jgi:hypothetical protein
VLSLAILDLHGGAPVTGRAALGGDPASRASGASGPRRKQCRLLPLDETLFSSRPGLLLMQVRSPDGGGPGPRATTASLAWLAAVSASAPREAAAPLH